ncbi:MAG: cysteine peptidase family C39 domain-containing protein, partial [Candidatus Omnitrophica bacterium]|nr:cysteine peptidase family C39 domain-containing protein [Candidatus Omnitrophota bacterium]
MNEGSYKKTEPESQSEIKKQEFRSSFKTWIRVVAFIVVAVFLPEQVAQAVEYDWRVLWRQPAVFTPTYLKDINQVDIPLTIKNILKDIANKPVNAIQLSPTLTVKLDKPLNISRERIEEIYNWLKGKPCGSKALFDYLTFKGAKTTEQDIAVMALTVDILNEVVKPVGSPKIIKNSLYALSKASEFFSHKLYPVKIDSHAITQGHFNAITPFIAHLEGEHYILVTKIIDNKVYFVDEHKEEFLPVDKFLQRFSGYALVSEPSDFMILSGAQAKEVRGAGDWDGGGGGYASNSGTWINNYGEEYGGNNYYVPQGFSIPAMPSFTSSHVTPTYYFPKSLYVNNAGFTNMQGRFENPAAIAFTSSRVTQNLTGQAVRNPLGSVPIFFNNGLDGMAFHVRDTAVIKAIDPSYVKGLGLDNVKVIGRTNVYSTYAEGPVHTADVYMTGIGLPVNHIAYQNTEFINENLKGIVTGGPSTLDSARYTPLPFTYRAFNTSPQEVAMVLDKPGQHFSWNYQAGPYMKPGDTVYGTGNQQLFGIGADQNTRHDKWSSYNQDLASANNLILPKYSDLGLRGLGGQAYVLKLNQQGNISPIIATQTVPANTPRHTTEGLEHVVYGSDKNLYQVKDIVVTNKVSKDVTILWNRLVEWATPGGLAPAEGVKTADVRIPGTDIHKQIIESIAGGSRSEVKFLDRATGKILPIKTAGLLETQNSGRMAHILSYMPASESLPPDLNKALDTLKKLTSGVSVKNL